MIEIYFDNVLIDSDNYTFLSNDYKLFTDNFKLGSVASNSFKLSVNKSAVTTHPTNVKIEDDNTSFYLIVDSVVEDNYVYTYTLTDKLVNFNFNYNANTIIQSKIALEEPCYLSDIWKDMCSQANVDYDDTYTFLNDIEVTWYDNTIQARKYLSYIAELQGGYACILENGKQSFRPYKKASSKTIDIDECSDFILGEKKTITRVIYDSGTDVWEFGNEDGSTLYLDNTNVFITSESMVENIYDLIVNFEFYIVDVPNAPMDSNVRAGDIITFTDGVNNYPTIAQYSMTYGGGWIGGYSLKVATDKQEETAVIKTKEQIKSIKSIVDRTNGTLSIISEQTDENSSKLVNLQISTDAISSSVTNAQNDITTINSSIQTIDGTINQIKVSGGNNLLRNTDLVETSGTDYLYWTGSLSRQTNINAKNGIDILLQDDTVSQETTLANGNYIIGFNYERLIALSIASVSINGATTTLGESGTYELPFTVSTNSLEVIFTCDTDNGYAIRDLMVNAGTVLLPYSNNQNEIRSEYVTIGRGIEIRSDTKNTINKLDADGMRVLNASTNEEVQTSTDEGGEFKKIVARENSTIAGLSINKVGTHVQINGVL